MRPPVARVRRVESIVGAFTPAHMLAAMLAEVPGHQRLHRDLRESAQRATRELPWLSVVGRERANAARRRLRDALNAIPDATFTATLVAVAYHLHDQTPDTPAWVDVFDAIERMNDLVGDAVVNAQAAVAEALVTDVLRDCAPARVAEAS